MKTFNFFYFFYFFFPITCLSQNYILKKSNFFDKLTKEEKKSSLTRVLKENGLGNSLIILKLVFIFVRHVTIHYLNLHISLIQIVGGLLLMMKLTEL